MQVRPAIREDLVAIGRLLHQAWWETYSDFVSAARLDRALEARYAPARLAERLLRNSCFVGTDDHEVVGFSEGETTPDRIILHTLYCQPDVRGRGYGKGLLRRVTDLSSELPVCSDVLLGNVQAEVFYESRGFSPGEVLHDDLLGEAVIFRRWWLPAARVEIRGWQNAGHGLR